MNYALPGNPNEELNRAQAVEYLVDACLNTEDAEFVSTSMRLFLRGQKTKEEVFADLRDAAGGCFVSVDADFLGEVYGQLEREIRRLYRTGLPAGAEGAA